MNQLQDDKNQISKSTQHFKPIFSWRANHMAANIMLIFILFILFILIPVFLDNNKIDIPNKNMAFNLFVIVPIAVFTLLTAYNMSVIAISYFSHRQGIYLYDKYFICVSPLRRDRVFQGETIHSIYLRRKGACWFLAFEKIDGSMHLFKQQFHEPTPWIASSITRKFNIKNPVRILLKYSKYTRSYHCPRCGYKVLPADYNCPECGLLFQVDQRN